MLYIKNLGEFLTETTFQVVVSGWHIRCLLATISILQCQKPELNITELLCTGLTVFPIEHGGIYGPPIFGLQFSQAVKELFVCI